VLLGKLHSVSLGPVVQDIQCDQLLAEWKRVDFVPGPSMESLQRLIHEGRLPSEMFNIDEIQNGGWVARNEMLFPRAVGSSWRLGLRGVSQRWISFELEKGDVAPVAKVVGEAFRARSKEQFVEAATSVMDEESVDILLSYQGTRLSYGKWPAALFPGIYRREHASLLVTSDHAKVLIDPTTCGGTWTTAAGKAPEDDLRDVDLILLTHGHTDHFDLPSILRYASDRTRVIVPKVPQVSMLCPVSFGEALRATGLDVIEAPWETSIKIADIEVDILPFYGEQPSRDSAFGRTLLRNWGNCYRINTPKFSTVVLADSGVDEAGSQIDVMAKSCEERGPVDVLLSCFFGFPEVINPGLSQYVLAVPHSEVCRVWSDRSRGLTRSVTLGAKGVAGACVAAKARYCLPYAHGFRAIGEDPRSPEAGRVSEDQVIHQVHTELAALGGSTNLLAWKPGDSIRFAERQGRIHRATGPSPEQ
jgi:hypothetical protein